MYQAGTRESGLAIVSCLARGTMIAVAPSGHPVLGHYPYGEMTQFSLLILGHNAQLWEALSY